MSCKLKDVSLYPAMHGPKVKNEYYPGSIMHGSVLIVENYRLDSIMHA
jgi:hypothetical protein